MITGLEYVEIQNIVLHLRRACVDDLAPAQADETEPPPCACWETEQDLHEDVKWEVPALGHGGRCFAVHGYGRRLFAIY
jgi:hypothetical protein